MEQGKTSPTKTTMRYHGKTGELYKIFLLNLFLGIITLGIYRFWGKTRERRYLASHITLGQDPFEYHGTGDELFWGMIKAFVLLCIVSFPFFLILFGPLFFDMPYPNPSTEPEIFALYNIIVLLYFWFYIIFLPHVAVYSSLRYRANRISWQNIRGFVKPGSVRYAIRGTLSLLLAIVTLGLWIPRRDVKLLAFQVKQLAYGDIAGTFQGKARQLFAVHLITGLISLTLGGISLLPLWVGLDLFSDDQFIDMLSPYIAIVYGLLITLPMMMVPRFWYQAAFNRLKYNHLSFGPVKFNCGMTGENLAELKISNFFIIILTLGLGYPWATHRRMRYLCRHLRLEGDIKQLIAKLATGKTDHSGEGMSTLMSISVRLF